MSDQPVERDVEVEGFGVSYDRQVVFFHQHILTRELNLKTILEMPSKGDKAESSIYSIGFAKAGCDVTVANFEERTRKYWQELDIEQHLKTRDVADYAKTDFPDNEFDLTWNYCTFAGLPDKDAYIQEMMRVSKKYVLLLCGNNFQLGYVIHKAVHFLYKFPWTHGDTHYTFLGNVRDLLTRNGLKIKECGTIDSPPWPSPVGFRDVRLHKKGISKTNYLWEVPSIRYMKSGQFPLWMNLIRFYDIPLRKGYWKLPFSHMFYLIGEKQA